LDRRRHITLGFERIEALLEAMGHPEREIPHIVQVVGTNGKGTTAVALAGALEASGRPSGAYLSPHVLSYTERVVLRGEYSSEEGFAQAMGETIELADRHGIGVSQFEILTAGALRMFADADVSWAVLEAGLGARHDATSVAGPEAVVLTNVALDHTEYLGDTIEEITAEKLASLRPGATLYLGSPDERVVGLARDTCRRVGANLVEVADPPHITAPAGLAPYAVSNVELGVSVAESLMGESLSGETRESVASDVVGTLPGRFEVREMGGVPVILDGGHNVAGVAAALASVRSAFPDRPFGVVFGVLRDKDAAGMLSGFVREAQMIVLTRPEGERASDPGRVGSEHNPLDREGRRALVVPDPVEALGAAVKAMGETGGVVLVTGSLSTIAPVSRWLREE
jgi:dihydrofolate synthase/folylpolyglutamate synthase